MACLALLAVAGATEVASAIDWQADQRIFESTDDLRGRIATDGDDLYVVYAYRSGSYNLVTFKSYDGERWTLGYEIDYFGSYQDNPVIAAGNGIVHVAWQDWRDGDSDIYYSFYNGTAWSKSVQISRDNMDQGQENPAIAIDGK
ncbi:MAG: hypothetical protein KAS77_04285, partial [Thermoplasmata archaeon]|nr:hypothetical protein [Thermoplasmata archaeon]